MYQFFYVALDLIILMRATLKGLGPENRELLEGVGHENRYFFGT
jgi:hypothetical protein